MIMKINEGLRSNFFVVVGEGDILYILGWPEILYATEGDHELLIFLPPSVITYNLCGARDQTWGFGHATWTSYQWSSILGQK